MFLLYREFFRALANPARFSIVQLLRAQPHNVSQIVEKLALGQSHVSHNLACLLNCGFVQWEWNGKNKLYQINPELLPVLSGIDKHLSRYAPSLDSCQVLGDESTPAVVTVKSSRVSTPRRRRQPTGRAVR